MAFAIAACSTSPAPLLGRCGKNCRPSSSQVTSPRLLASATGHGRAPDGARRRTGTTCIRCTGARTRSSTKFCKSPEQPTVESNAPVVAADEGVDAPGHAHCARPAGLLSGTRATASEIRGSIICYKPVAKTTTSESSSECSSRTARRKPKPTTSTARDGPTSTSWCSQAGEHVAAGQACQKMPKRAKKARVHSRPLLWMGRTASAAGPSRKAPTDWTAALSSCNTRPMTKPGSRALLLKHHQGALRCYQFANDVRMHGRRDEYACMSEAQRPCKTSAAMRLFQRRRFL